MLNQTNKKNATPDIIEMQKLDPNMSSSSYHNLKEVLFIHGIALVSNFFLQFLNGTDGIVKHKNGKPPSARFFL